MTTTAKTRRGKLTIRTANDELHLLTGEIYKVLADNFKRSDIYASCLSCKHWNPEAEVCNKYQQRPPAHVIVDACESYEDHSEIPF